MAKLQSKHIKKKVREKFGAIQVFNPQYFLDTYKELFEIIKENSNPVELEEEGLFDVEVSNLTKIMRFMLINISNLENEEYWNSLNDSELDEKLTLADGEFKQVVDTLMDIVVEIAEDVRKENVRKMKLAESRLFELTETFKFNNNVDEKLKEYGIDSNTILAIQNILGQENLIEESK